jgi:hypothetical protein
VAYYDLGEEGIAYHDFDSKNNGSGTLNPADGSYQNEFRIQEGVDISYTKFHDSIDAVTYANVRLVVFRIHRSEFLRGALFCQSPVRKYG